MTSCTSISTRVITFNRRPLSTSSSSSSKSGGSHEQASDGFAFDSCSGRRGPVAACYEGISCSFDDTGRRRYRRGRREVVSGLLLGCSVVFIILDGDRDYGRVTGGEATTPEDRTATRFGRRESGDFYEQADGRSALDNCSDRQRPVVARHEDNPAEAGLDRPQCTQRGVSQTGRRPGSATGGFGDARRRRCVGR